MSKWLLYRQGEGAGSAPVAIVHGSSPGAVPLYHYAVLVRGRNVWVWR